MPFNVRKRSFNRAVLKLVVNASSFFFLCQRAGSRITEGRAHSNNEYEIKHGRVCCCWKIINKEVRSPLPSQNIFNTKSNVLLLLYHRNLLTIGCHGSFHETNKLLYFLLLSYSSYYKQPFPHQSLLFLFLEGNKTKKNNNMLSGNKNVLSARC